MAEKEYIERKKAIDACFDGWNNNAHDCAENIRAIPAADVRPVLKAKIVDMRYAEDDGEWKCTHCGWQYTLCVCGKDVTSKIRFCPNCGADMRPTSMSGANGEES